jgi:antitoxin component of MazEF toxin-antitoxin module
MSRRQIVLVADLAAIFFAKEELKEIGLNIGDDVEVILEENRIIIRPTADIELDEMIGLLAEQLFERRSEVYKQL